MLKTVLTFAILIASLTNSMAQFTDTEQNLIQSQTADIPFRVLLTTNQSDYLVLRTKSEDIDTKNIEANKDLQLLIERLIVTLEVEQGVGIAAPQVGISRNLFLFIRTDKPDYPLQVAINPRIVAHADSTICFERDGCLSIPNVSEDTVRYPWIEVEYTDLQGKLVRERLEGHSRTGNFAAVIFQHEYDHLEGVFFTDKICHCKDKK